MVLGDTGRTGVPYWPDPEYGNEFVRSLGPLRKRLRRGVTPWVGESYFVDARRGIRLCASTAGGEAARPDPQLRPVYRRFYSDGVVGRLEIAFRRGRTGASELDDRAIQAWVSQVALTEVRRPIALSEGTPIVRFGDQLAGCLLEGTTSSRRRPIAVPDWWVRAGNPVVVTELTFDEVGYDSPLYDALGAEFNRLEDHQAVIVDQRWQTIGAKQVSTWTLVASPCGTWEIPRKLRVHALRCHADLEALRAVGRLCGRRRLDPGETAVKDFLDERTKFLLRRRFDEFPQRDLLERIVESVEEGYVDELLAIRSLAGTLGPGLSGKLDDLSAIVTRASSGATINVFAVTKGVIVNVTNDNSLNISGGTVGAAQAGSGNVQNVGGVSQTVAQGADLTALVADLMAAVTSLRGQVPDDVADEGEDLVTAVQEEAGKDEPDAGRLSRWLDRVKDWAEKVGDVAAPVLSVVGAVSQLIV